MVRYRTTAVKSGNGVGKSFLAAGILLWAAASHAPCKVVCAAPTKGQLEGVLWAEATEAYRRALYPLGGKWGSLRWELGDNWLVEGWGSGSVESKSGRHAGDLIAIIDEASGVSANVLEAIASLNPSRILYLGNPLRPEGKFYEVCERSADNPHVNVITVPSLESPHIDLARSPVGMADRTWLDSARFEYGEDSRWWLSHVLARFPGELDSALLPIAWLNAAAERWASYDPALDNTPTRMGIDIGKGEGGDDSCIVVRTDRAIVAAEWSNRWDLGETAKRAAALAGQWGVDPSRIVFDASNLGTDFGNRLAQHGIHGARDYMGSRSGGEKFANLRSAAGWMMRRRLDPGRAHTKPGHQPKPQVPFAIRPDLLNTFRAELQGLRYEELPTGEIALEVKDRFVERLKRSPNFLDAAFMTFAFPHS